MGDTGSTDTLMAGYAAGSILVDGQLDLIGMYCRTPRVGKKIRDDIMVRAVALAKGDSKFVLTACDLLCISEELHSMVVQMVPDLADHELILAATHTHSSFGGFFPSSATSAMLGKPRPEILDKLSDRIAKVIKESLEDLRPATMQTGRGSLPGLTASRREAYGPFDDEVYLLCLERKGRRPIHVMSSSGHPVLVSEREPHSISSDYPGMICRILQDEGIDPAFFSSALAGVSILFPEFQMDADRHLDLLGGLLFEAHKRAVAHLEPVAFLKDSVLYVEKFHVPHGPHRTRAFSPMGLGGRLADLALSPALKHLRAAVAQGLANHDGICVHLLRAGDWVFVASAAEMGVTMVKAIRNAAEDAGAKNPMVASQAGGYAGYMHLEDVYKRIPQKGYRYMALYENALALFGFQMGQELVDALRHRLG